MIERLRTASQNRFVEIGATCVGLSLLGLVLREALSDTAGFEFSWVPAILASLFFGASWLGLSMAWTLLAKGVADPELSFRWLRSQLLRYVPGGVWAPISRFADMDGTNRQRATLLGVETLSILSMATMIGSLAAAFVRDRWWLLLAVCAGLGLVICARVAFRSAGSIGAIAEWLGVLAVSLSCYLVGSGLAQGAIGRGIPFWDAATAGILSWVVGYLVVVAPSGIGIKEWAYLGLLAAADRPTAAAGVLAARLLFVVGEVVVVSGSILERRWNART